MIAGGIIGRNFCSRLALIGLGIREAQVEIFINGIGLIPNGIGPYEGQMNIPPIPLSSVTSNFIPSSPTSCCLILLPIGGFVVFVIILGFPVNFSGD